MRTEGTRAYVYKRGEDGLLKKTYVSTGEQLWGYIRILSGLSEKDYIAFPYGKNVKDGATTVEDDGSGSDYAINDGVLYKRREWKCLRMYILHCRASLGISCVPS